MSIHVIKLVHFRWGSACEENLKNMKKVINDLNKTNITNPNRVHNLRYALCVDHDMDAV